MANWRMCVGLIEKIKSLLNRSTAPLVRQIMTSPAITAPADMVMTEAFLIFAERGINHLPVVDADNRLLGIVTRLDLLSAIYGDLS
jgi:CBS domain-containing membrane protein